MTATLRDMLSDGGWLALARGSLRRVFPLELQETSDFTHDFYLYLSLELREG